MLKALAEEKCGSNDGICSSKPGKKNVEKENANYQQYLLLTQYCQRLSSSFNPLPDNKILDWSKLKQTCRHFNPVPHLPILGSSNSAANYDMMS